MCYSQAKRANTFKSKIPQGVKCATTLSFYTMAVTSFTKFLPEILPISIRKLDKNTHPLYKALKLKFSTTVMTELFQGD